MTASDRPAGPQGRASGEGPTASGRREFAEGRAGPGSRSAPRGRRVVLTTFGSFGDLNPYVGLALELERRGHRPVVATSPAYRDYVEAHGLAFRPVRPDVDPEDEALVARVLDPWRGPEVIVRELLVPHLEESFQDLGGACRDADLLVTHPITLAGPVVAEDRGLPWVSTILAPLSLFSRRDPPVPPALPGAPRALVRAPLVGRLGAAVARRITRSWVAPVRRLREARGLPPGGHPLFEGQHSPHRVLAMFSRVLAAPQPDWPARTLVTGHIFHDGPASAGAGAADRPKGGTARAVGAVRRAPADRLSPALRAFLEEGPPPLVFTLGSAAVADPGSFYEESVEAARRLGRRAVLLTGGAPPGAGDRAARAAASATRSVTASPGDGSAAPGAGSDAARPAAILESGYEPYSALFPRAAAVIHHGGIGTTAQALRAGRPQLVVPRAHDQPDNASRVERLGVARVLSARRYRADRAAASLRTLLDDAEGEEPSGAEPSGAAAEVARAVRAEDGVGTACDALEERLRAVVA